MTEHVDSAPVGRTGNNAKRHQYCVLSDIEKAQMMAAKDKGAEFLALLEGLHTLEEPAETGSLAVVARFDRELIIAKERVEEAVMCAVKHVTA